MGLLRDYCDFGGTPGDGVAGGWAGVVEGAGVVGDVGA